MKTQKEGYDSEGKKTQNCALLRIAVLLLEISGLNLSLGAFILQGNRYFVIFLVRGTVDFKGNGVARRFFHQFIGKDGGVS